MRTIAILFLTLVAACGAMMGDELATISAFSPQITPEGKQSFTFVARNQRPSYYQGDLSKFHQQLLGNELGKRQYCMKGYDIVNTHTTEDNIVYEGVCRT